MTPTAEKIMADVMIEQKFSEILEEAPAEVRKTVCDYVETMLDYVRLLRDEDPRSSHDIP